MLNVKRYYKSISIATVATPNDPTAAAANTVAINALLASVTGTDIAIYIPPGIWYYTGNILIIGCVLFGEGSPSILSGTDGASTPRCAVQLSGNHPVARWFDVHIVGTTARSSNNATANGVTVGCQGNALVPTIGHVIEGVNTVGAACVGIGLQGGNQGRIVNSSTTGSWADGINHTRISQNCEVDRCVTTGAGDDNFSIVSYLADGAPCVNVLVHKGQGLDQVGGRGITVVGGNNCTYRSMYVRKAWSRGIYLTSEGGGAPTYGVNDALVDDTVIDGTGAQGSPYANGAQGCYINGGSGATTSNVTVRATVKGNPQALSVVGGSNVSNVDVTGLLQG